VWSFSKIFLSGRSPRSRPRALVVACPHALSLPPPRSPTHACV
jgi:hypothetical protein